MFCKIKPIIGGLDEKAKRTVMFAAKELSRYLRTADSGSDFPVVPTAEYTQNEDNTIWLVVGHKELPQVEDVKYDDAIYISTKGYCGVIAGTNARALLIAVYRFLRENGFAFTKPGKNGEVIPNVLPVNELNITEKASYRHRGICIEGSVYQEGLVDLLDWLPKVSMNAYFLQFLEPSVFVRRYYTNIKGHTLTGEEVEGMGAIIRDEIVKRSLLFHDVGHGWTCAAMGIDKHEIHTEPESITEEQREMLALVNGKREFWGHNPLNTNLCYTNPKVVEIMTDNILDYCIKHPEVDYIHFWVADGGNNNCECENCSKLHSSDHYVKMLNRLDEKLTENNIDTKVVFLIYSGLVWAPVQERVKNKDRFTMMFAPFIRDFTHSLEVDMPMKLPPYHLNHQAAEVIDIAEHLSYFKDWRPTFDGDSFDFDYHYCVEFLFDLTGYDLAKVLHQDIRTFEPLTMNGLVSCQNQRNYMPTALGMNVMAATLWNKEIAFDEIMDKLFRNQFGEDGKLVEEYIKSLAAYNCEGARRHGTEDVYSEAVRARMIKTIEIIDDFKKVAEEKLAAATDVNIKQNWEVLLFAGEINKGMYNCYLAEDNEAAKVVYDELVKFAEAEADKFKIEFDFLCFKDVFRCPQRP
ncbi:MAG: DUF4838 domain-containing protein [Oscillospiraceae bacterium]|nr:DUF4838 domain-containing protein [Oscillospiraceae bacterium]